MQNPNNYLVQGQSDTASYTSNALPTSQWVSSSFMAIFDENTAAGTIQLQFSNDPPLGNPSFTPTNWANVPGSTATATITAGATGVVYTPVNFVSRWLRVVFTRSAGAGTFSITYNALFP